MNIIEVLSLKFPTADVYADFIVRDDGNGLYIDKWNIVGVEKPTQEDLQQWEIELQEQYQFQQNRIMNKPIYEELNNIDMKSIRAIRNNDITRLNELESQAINLRAQLLPTE